MANSINDLFGDVSLRGRDLISTPAMSLNDLALSGAASSDGVKTKVDLINRVVPRIDYSDFSKFVFFNSALDYFNISGDRIINEFPYDGTYDDELAFQTSSDHYQNYLISQAWPRWSGAIDMSVTGGYPAVTVSDTLKDTPVPLLSVGTGSFTIESRIFIPTLPADDEMMPIMQRSPNIETSGSNINVLSPSFYNPTWSTFLFRPSGSLPQIGMFLSGVFLSGTTGSVFTYNISPTASMGMYSSWVVDQSGSTVSLYLTIPAWGSVAKFTDKPYLAQRWDAVFPSGGLSTSTSYLTIGLGALLTQFTSSATLIEPDFHIGEVRYWNFAKNADDIFLSYNTRAYKEDSLILYLRFAEPYPVYDVNGLRSYIAKDYSGNKLDGRIISRLSGSSPSPNTTWVSASMYGDAGFGMSPQDTGEPLLSGRASLVQSYVLNTQATASLYDRNNANIITNFVPKQFLSLEDDQNTSVLRNLLYLLGRQFDEIKVYIDQISKLFIADQSGFNTTPDALLADALQFWGWSPKGNFLNKEAFQWLFGMNVLSRTRDDVQQQKWTNEKLDVELYEIKNEFWRRTLNSLPYLYKKKGTKESVDALFRIYGLDSSIIRLKEFGYKPNVKIQTQRINGLKSATALKVAQTSGTFYVSSSAGLGITDGVFTVEAQVMFPPSGSVIMPPTLMSGTIFSMEVSGTSEVLSYTRPPAGVTPSYLGTLIYRASAPGVTSSVTFNASVFDGRWYHINMSRTGTALQIDMQHLDTDVIDISTTMTGSVSGVLYGNNFNFNIAKPSGSINPGELWLRNVQVWHMSQSLTELQDHTLNPFGMGTDTPTRLTNQKLHWKLDELIDSDNNSFYDASQSANSGSIVHLTLSGSNTWAGGTDFYGRFNISYNFIAPPDFSWTEDKIRYVDNPKPGPADRWMEVNDAAVELNLVDALNEDISNVISSLENWNNMIGAPASRYRGEYQELEQLRQQYFARLTGRVNFRAFADFMDFFDRSFLDLVKRLIPARVDFKGAELVVESHMLERPKVQYAYRPHDILVIPEGVISVYSPFSSLQVTMFVSGNSP